ELSGVEATDRAPSGARGGQGGLNAASGETNPRPGTARLCTRVAHRPPPSARVAPVLLVRRPVRVVVPRSLRFRPGHLRGPAPAGTGLPVPRRGHAQGLLVLAHVPVV